MLHRRSLVIFVHIRESDTPPVEIKNNIGEALTICVWLG